jgi:hypothetical protein
MLLYKCLHKNEKTLEHLTLVDCKEDLTHMFSEVTMDKLKSFELSDFSIVPSHKIEDKVKQKTRYEEHAPNPMSKIPLNKLKVIIELKIVDSPTITNRIFEVIVTNLFFLKHLEFGGKPREFNHHITLSGVRILWGKEEGKDDFSNEGENDFHEDMGLKSNLTTLKIHYCSKIGKQAIEAIWNRFGPTLATFSVIRNFYEFSAKIPDEALKSIEKWEVLQNLEIVYSRNFDYDCIKYISSYGRHLRLLNLSDWPIQESLEPLCTGCPFLEELNMSGDSWVKEDALVGLCKYKVHDESDKQYPYKFGHQKLQILHLGHYEHADIEWMEYDEPEKGKFLGKLLGTPWNLPSLKFLYLNKWCLSPYIQDILLKYRENVTVETVDNELIEFAKSKNDFIDSKFSI